MATCKKWKPLYKHPNLVAIACYSENLRFEQIEMVNKPCLKFHQYAVKEQ